MVLIIDNYDSFVYNLARYSEELGMPTTVYRNDAVTLEDIKKINPYHIFLSPGPCSPTEAGICLSLIKHFYQSIPILGICLGHQAIAQALGGTVMRAKEPMHGRAASIHHNQAGIFQNLPNPLVAARYHSLIVDESSLPNKLNITAHSERGEIMALSHTNGITHGVQFHPESILTPDGKKLLHNFLKIKSLQPNPKNDELAVV